jgi:hypothetical protein
LRLALATPRALLIAGTAKGMLFGRFLLMDLDLSISDLFATFIFDSVAVFLLFFSRIIVLSRRPE